MYLVQAIWTVCSAVVVYYDIFRMINFLVFMAGMEHSEKTQRIPKGLSKCFVFSLACPFSVETKQKKLRKFSFYLYETATSVCVLRKIIGAMR